MIIKKNKRIKEKDDVYVTNTASIIFLLLGLIVLIYFGYCSYNTTQSIMQYIKNKQIVASEVKKEMAEIIFNQVMQCLTIFTVSLLSFFASEKVKNKIENDESNNIDETTTENDSLEN